jgi:hypothetical protein
MPPDSDASARKGAKKYRKEQKTGCVWEWLGILHIPDETVRQESGAMAG